MMMQIFFGIKVFKGDATVNCIKTVFYLLLWQNVRQAFKVEDICHDIFRSNLNIRHWI